MYLVLLAEFGGKDERKKWGSSQLLPEYEIGEQKKGDWAFNLKFFQSIEKQDPARDLLLTTEMFNRK
jgi:hypothetical protein